MNVLNNATPAQLEQAVANNHRELFALNAIAQGGEVYGRNGLNWTYAGAGNSSVVLFPVMDAATAGTQLDEMMDHYRAQPPKDAG